ncbi:hypothetical protein S40293_04033 [Stachybotrys chartarum IBT 40293]|nr:hypothetical protein S40293_04033 [Stachybotrys chartarum IBT 40293]
MHVKFFGLALCLAHAACVAALPLPHSNDAEGTEKISKAKVSPPETTQADASGWYDKQTATPDVVIKTKASTIVHIDKYVTVPLLVSSTVWQPYTVTVEGTALATATITESITAPTPVTTTLQPATTTTITPVTVLTTLTKSRFTTEIVYITHTTVTATNYRSTSTATLAVATEIAVPFHLAVDDKYGKGYLYVERSSETVHVTEDVDKAAECKLTLDGSVRIDGRVLVRSSNDGVQTVKAIPMESLLWANFGIFRCNIVYGSELACGHEANGADTWATTLLKNKDGSMSRVKSPALLHATWAEIYTYASKEQGTRTLPVSVKMVALS